MPDLENIARSVRQRTTQALAQLLDDDGAVLDTVYAWPVDRTGDVDVRLDAAGQSFLDAVRTYRMRWNAAITFGRLLRFSDTAAGSMWRVQSEPASVGRRAWMEIDVTSVTVGDVTGPVEEATPASTLLGTNYVPAVTAVYDPHYSYPVLLTQGIELSRYQYVVKGTYASTARAYYGAEESHVYPVSDYRRYDISGPTLDPWGTAGVGRYRWKWASGTPDPRTAGDTAALAQAITDKLVGASIELQFHNAPSAPTHSQVLELLRGYQQNFPYSQGRASIGPGRSRQPLLLDNTYDPSTGRPAFDLTGGRVEEEWGVPPDYDHAEWAKWHLGAARQVGPTLEMGRSREVTTRRLFYVRAGGDAAAPPDWGGAVIKKIWAQKSSGRVVQVGAIARPVVQATETAGETYLSISGAVGEWGLDLSDVRSGSPLWIGTSAPGGVPSRWIVTSIFG